MRYQWKLQQMKLRLIILSLTFTSITSMVNSQIGGENTYRFLDLESSARVAAVGGNMISVKDNDVNLALNNPALLNESMSQQAALSYVNYFAGINYGYGAYAHHFDSIATFMANFQYLDYGEFVRSNQFGDKIGTFSGGEYALAIGAATTIDSLYSVGANLKVIYSGIESYSSFGMAMDIGGTYHNPEKRFTASGVLKNIGYQFSGYTADTHDKLPFEVQVGISQKLAHAPLRFSLTLENLQRWDLTYVDPTIKPQIDPITQEVGELKTPGFMEKSMRHVVVGGELLLLKAFHVNFGFNYRKRQELKLIDRPGMTGFSIGFDMKIKRFQLSYGRSSYHRAGASNHFSITSNISEWRTK